MKLWYAVVLSMTMAVAASGLTVQDLETRLSRAKAEMASGNWAQAESMLQAIIEDDENYAPAFFELSVVFLERDNLKGAQENITKAIEKDPRNDEFRSKAERIAALSGGMSRARRAYDERDFDNAILEYDKVVSEFPRFASAHFVACKSSSSTSYSLVSMSITTNLPLFPTSTFCRICCS